MRILGITLLAFGLIMGVYSLNMDVGIDVPAADYGYGIKTPATRVANVDRMEQRQNMTIFSGALVLGGILLLGFSSMGQRKIEPARMLPEGAQPPEQVQPPAPTQSPHQAGASEITICPACRSMHTGAIEVCKCGKSLT